MTGWVNCAWVQAALRRVGATNQCHTLPPEGPAAAVSLVLANRVWCWGVNRLCLGNQLSEAVTLVVGVLRISRTILAEQVGSVAMGTAPGLDGHRHIR